MFACAAAFLRMPIACTTSSGIRSTPGQPIEKWWIERSVCAPQYLEASTSIAPSESVSVRYSVMAGFLRGGVPAIVASAARPRPGRPGVVHASA